MGELSKKWAVFLAIIERTEQQQSNKFDAKKPNQNGVKRPNFRRAV